MFKTILRVAWVVIGTITGFVLIYLGSAYYLSRIPVNEAVAEKDEVEIFILTNGMHTDLVFPIKNNIKDWSQCIKFSNTVGKDTTANFVAFGWGDKGFYLETPTWADLKFSVAFKAAFALSTSAIHTTFYKKLNEGERCRKIKISADDYRKAVEYVSSSFETTGEGKLININTNAQYGLNDSFYEATGSYSLFHTCNTWANNGLKACGQKASLWTPFDTGIFYHYSQTK